MSQALGILFTIIVVSNYTYACFESPMGKSKKSIDSVLRALSDDPKVSHYEVVSITDAHLGEQYAIILKEDKNTETRIYSVKHVPLSCGDYEATRLK